MLFDPSALLLFGAIAVPCAFLAVRYWQHALLGVFILLVFEGALRKWAFPWAQAQIYLVKDAILLAAYLGFVLDRGKGQAGPGEMMGVKVALVVSFLFGCIEVLNPNSPSILIGLVGLKTYFLYAPIAFILPYTFTSQEQFLTLIRRYLIMAIPVAVLGFVQVAAGPGSSLNTYVSHSEDAAPVLAYFGRENDIVRTSGTFSYISGYTAFLSFIAFLGIGYNLAQGWRIKNNIAPLISLTLAVGAMFTTGSRTPVYTLIIAGPVILLLALAGKVVSLRTVVRLFVLLPLIALAALSISPRAFQAFADRATDAGTDDTLTRMISPLSETIYALSNAPVFGVGIGTTHPSSMAIMAVEWPWWLQGLLTEGETARITVELGFIGLLLTLCVRCLIAVFALRWAMSFKDPAYRALGILLAVYLALGVAGSIMLNPTAGLYYWGAAGLLMAMRRLERLADSRSKIVLTTTQARLTQPALYAK
jgi:O-Antigen ligase